MIDNISLSVEDKEFLVILGPSGSGKTTLLRIIAGLEKPDSGKIIIGEKDVTGLSPKERDVAMVFQNYALYPHMSVFENIALPLKVRGLRRDEIEKKVENVASLLKINTLLDKKPSQISGGEQQRVALARAIVRNPKVFLFDEPLSNLDAKLRATTRGFIKRLQKELGITTIYVTHDQLEGMTMADRIAVMNKGRLLQVDEPEKIYNYPADTFVADFIGSPPMNLIEGKIEKNEKQYFVSGSIRFELENGLLDNKEVILGIRPEDIIISESYLEGSFKGTIYVYEPAGKIQYITVDIDGTKIILQADLSFKSELNKSVYIKFKEKAYHLFSRETGQRIKFD